mmetsp:Transcript_76431/g.181810  ORF Transcript_76431/g.181810 Transcript_76431/m.181810 type:complete len:478 (-) Transcript_76431:112-1545(-)
MRTAATPQAFAHGADSQWPREHSLPDHTAWAPHTAVEVDAGWKAEIFERSRTSPSELPSHSAAAASFRNATLQAPFAAEPATLTAVPHEASGPLETLEQLKARLRREEAEVVELRSRLARSRGQSRSHSRAPSCDAYDASLSEAGGGQTDTPGVGWNQSAENLQSTPAGDSLADAPPSLDSWKRQQELAELKLLLLREETAAEELRLTLLKKKVAEHEQQEAAQSPGTSPQLQEEVQPPTHEVHLRAWEAVRLLPTLPESQPEMLPSSQATTPPHSSRRNEQPQGSQRSQQPQPHSQPLLHSAAQAPPSGLGTQEEAVNPVVPPEPVPEICPSPPQGASRAAASEAPIPPRTSVSSRHKAVAERACALYLKGRFEGFEVLRPDAVFWPFKDQPHAKHPANPAHFLPDLLDDVAVNVPAVQVAASTPNSSPVAEPGRTMQGSFVMRDEPASLLDCGCTQSSKSQQHEFHNHKSLEKTL